MRKSGSEFTSLSTEKIADSNELRSSLLLMLPQMGANWHRHSLVTMRVEATARMLYLDSLYRNIVNIPGVVMEFGVQWGATLTQLMNLRSIYEPFNFSRTIIGFDTFQGFAHIDEVDGKHAKLGDYASQENHYEALNRILNIHESASTFANKESYELVQGDAGRSVPQWLAQNPHAVISLAIFDMDLHKPTKEVLESIIPRLVRGALIVFDEFNCSAFPGETIAALEVLEHYKLKFTRSTLQPYCSWAVWGE